MRRGWADRGIGWWRGGRKESVVCWCVGSGLPEGYFDICRVVRLTMVFPHLYVPIRTWWRCSLSVPYGSFSVAYK